MLGCCSYLIKGILSNGASFTAYTYAGELPSCAFGFNSHGLVFRFLLLLLPRIVLRGLKSFIDWTGSDPFCDL